MSSTPPKSFASGARGVRAKIRDDPDRLEETLTGMRIPERLPPAMREKFGHLLK